MLAGLILLSDNDYTQSHTKALCQVFHGEKGLRLLRIEKPKAIILNISAAVYR